MRARTAFLLVILGSLGIFAALNWSVFTAATSLNLVFARVDAPLGVIMLGVTTAVTLFYALLVAWRETSVLLEARHHAKELEVQRRIAESAEAFRRRLEPGVLFSPAEREQMTLGFDRS